MTSRAGKGPLVTGLVLALERATGLLGSEAGVDGDDGLLLGKQNPITRLFRQLAPGPVDVDAHRNQDIALILATPRGGPGGDGALTDGQRVIRYHRPLGRLVDAAETVACRAGALRRVWRE